jgi:glycogen operon protein
VDGGGPACGCRDARAHTGLSLGIYRDLALGTAPDGGEIWANPEQFALGVSLGAPPDPFARDGQVWQLAPFEPHALRHSGYDPFIAMLTANMRHAGVLRIDHILGFSRQFWVPQGSPGKDGAYVNFPLDVLLAITAIESHRARCTIIGEDLGTVPEGLRERLGGSDILSYRVLWFEKDGESFRPPDRYPPLSVSCLSSHDLPTFVGWRRGRDIEIDRETGRLGAEQVAPRQEARRREEQSLREAIRLAGLAAGESDSDLMAAAHELLAQAPSALVLVQADDLGEETEPLNVPGTDRERPNWRQRRAEPCGAAAPRLDAPRPHSGDAVEIRSSDEIIWAIIEGAYGRVALEIPLCCRSPLAESALGQTRTFYDVRLMSGLAT